MRLTDHTDYSLRVLMYLNQKKELVTLSELASTLQISRNNLIKASNQLAKHGFIETSRGPGGGLTIRPEAGRASLKDIISKTEETFALAECFQETKSSCTFLRRCRLKKSLNQALDAFLNSLGQTTLNDVTMSI
jgi:Rrf2 family transcriptional regulator, nitric oxide-sensitive transcriptional repressor